MATAYCEASETHSHILDINEEGELIGSGAYGEVHKVQCRVCSAYFARKYISKSEESSTYWSRKRRDFMNRELSFLKKFQHPNTLKYVHHLIPSPDAKELYIWTELCKYGDLHRLRRPLSEEFLWHLAEALGSTLSTCHHGLSVSSSDADGKIQFEFLEHKQIVHRDLKPSNVFFTQRAGANENLPDPRQTKSPIIEWRDDYVIKVGDFGMAVELGEDGAHTFTGTTVFLAPEILNAKIRDIERANKRKIDANQRASRKDDTGKDGSTNASPASLRSDKSMIKWTPECDIYSVGLTLLCLALGWEAPLSEKPVEFNYEARKKSFKENLDKAKNQVSDNLIKLICQCLDPIPDKRPTALAILAVSLKGPYSKKTLPQSLSLWNALAHRRGKSDHGNVVGRTICRFSTDYLHDMTPAYTGREICIIMALISLYQVGGVASLGANLLLNAGNQMVKGLAGEEATATALHTAAAIPMDDDFLRKLTWDTTKWPLDKSLRKLALQKDSRNFRPAMVAAMSGNLVAARQLADIEDAARNEEMEAKIAKSVDDCRKETAAHGAAEVEFLLKFVVNENKRHPWKPHKIQYASAALVLAAAQGHTNVVKVLIDGLNACQVNAAIRVGDGKTTALHAAAITGQMEVVTLLLEHYTSECIDRVDAAGYTALHQASHKGDARIVNALLEANANINAADKRGKTALYLAASADHAEVVQLLLRRGADRKLRGGTAQLTALEVAVERGCNAVLPLLQDDKILFGETQDSRGQSQPVSQDTPQDSEPSKPPKAGEADV